MGCQQNMNILYTVLRFSRLTGSEIYVYELAREMIKKGHKASILSDCGDLIADKAKEIGIELLSKDDLKGKKFDILHLSHHFYSELALKKFPKTPAVMTIHSEVIPEFEYPIDNKNIKYFICIRKTIADQLKEKGYKNTEIIYNPIDYSRFNKDGLIPNKKRIILFVGRPDSLRAQTILHLIDSIRFTENSSVWFIGKGFEKYGLMISDVLPARAREKVNFMGEIWNTEQYVKQCSITASVMMGRTTIEGWACGKPGFIFNIDKDGKILDIKVEEPPKNMARFDSRVVADQIERLYRKAL